MITRLKGKAGYVMQRHLLTHVCTKCR